MAGGGAGEGGALVGLDGAVPLLAANAATGLLVDWQGRVHPVPGIQTYLAIRERQLASIALRPATVPRFQISLSAR